MDDAVREIMGSHTGEVRGRLAALQSACDVMLAAIKEEETNRDGDAIWSCPACDNCDLRDMPRCPVCVLRRALKESRKP